MKRNARRGLLAAALIAGLAYVIPHVAAAKENELVHVLVARFDLPVNTVIDEDLVVAAQVARKDLLPGAMVVQSMSDVKKGSGMVTSSRIPEYSKAIADCSRAISRDPAYAKAYYIRAAAYRESGADR